MDPRAIYTLDMLTSAGAAPSLGASFVTRAQKLEMTPGYAIQFTWTGASTPVGTVMLQCSNDASNWSDIDETSVEVSGAANSITYNVERPCYLYVRVQYTRTSGSGTGVTIKINGVN